MFSVSCKDPLQSVKVGERRDLKARATPNQSITPNSDDSNHSRPQSAATVDSPPLPSHLNGKSFFFSPITTPVSGRNTNTPLTAPDIDSDAGHGSASALDSYFAIKPQRNHPTRNVDRPPVARPKSQTRSHSPDVRKTFFQKIGMTTKSPPLSSCPTPLISHSMSKVSVLDSHWSGRDSSSIHPAPSINQKSSPMSRFNRLLRKIEIANDHASSARLALDWDGQAEDQDMEAEFHFETSLWALVNVEKIRTTKPAKLIVQPNVEYDAHNLFDIRDSMHVMHLGPIHDSPMRWYLGAKHPAATFHSLGLRDANLDLSSSSWGSPPNTESRVWAECPHFNLPDNTYDMIIVQDLFHVVRCTDWTTLIHEVSRLLVSGGVLVVSLMDPLPTRSGPLLSAWTRKNLEITLAQKFMVPQPSLMVPHWIDETGAFSEPLIESIEFPCYPALAPNLEKESLNNGRKMRGSQSPSPMSSPLIGTKKSRYSTGLHQIHENRNCLADDEEAELDSLIGKHLFEKIYDDCLPTRQVSHLKNPVVAELKEQEWWWHNQAIVDECRRFDTAFQTMTFFYQKT